MPKKSQINEYSDVCWRPSTVRGAREAMSRMKRRLVADELVEFEKQPVEVQDSMKFTDRFRGIYRIYRK